MIILRFDMVSDSHTFGFSVNPRDLGLTYCQTYHALRLSA
jgi:hypothetical protein